MTKMSSIQDSFLNNVRKVHTPVIIFLINGKKLQGKVEAFDNFVILFKNNENGLQMIYKHAISNIFPSSSDDTKNLTDLLRNV